MKNKLLAPLFVITAAFLLCGCPKSVDNNLVNATNTTFGKAVDDGVSGVNKSLGN